MIGHGHRVFVGLPGDQAGLVGLARDYGSLRVIDTGWGQVRLHSGLFLAVAESTRQLAGAAVPPLVGGLVQPVGQGLLQVLPAGEGFAVQAVVLDIFDPGLDLALAFRIVAFAGPDRKAGRGRTLMEALVQGQFPEPLMDHDQLGLVVHALRRPAAEIAEGGIVLADQRLGINREPTRIHASAASRIRRTP